MHVVNSNQLELDAVQAAGSVDLINSHLSSVLNSDTVHSGAAGQRTGYTDDELSVVGSVAAAGVGAGSKQAQAQSQGKNNCNGLCEFHLGFPPIFYERYLS